MKKGLLTLFIAGHCTMLCAQWSLLSSGTIANLNDIEFISTSIGFAVGDSSIVLKTENSGTTWQRSDIALAWENLYAVATVNDTIALAAGGDPGFICNRILRTPDQGSTWNSIVFCGTGGVVTDLYFPNPDTGYAVEEYWSTNSSLLVTFNSGASWTYLNGWNNSPIDNVFGVFYLNTTFGYMVGSDANNDGLITSTSDGGISWSYIDTVENRPLRGIEFTDMNNGIAVGDSGIIVRTTDAGATWTQINSGTNAHLAKIRFIDPNIAYVVGSNGIILYTNNGGISWSMQNSGVSTDLNSVHFTGPNTGYVCGDNGIILETNNGGNSIEEREVYQQLNIYPNPAKDHFYIDFPDINYDQYYLEIYNSIGVLVKSNFVNEGNSINISSLPSGIYYASCYDSMKFVGGAKFIVE